MSLLQIVYLLQQMSYKPHSIYYYSIAFFGYISQRLFFPLCITQREGKKEEDGEKYLQLFNQFF